MTKALAVDMLVAVLILSLLRAKMTVRFADFAERPDVCQKYFQQRRSVAGHVGIPTTAGGTAATTMMLTSALIPAPTNLLFALVAFSALTLQRSAIHTTFDHHDDVVGTSIRLGTQRRVEATRVRTDRTFPSRVAYVAEDGIA